MRRTGLLLIGVMAVLLVALARGAKEEASATATVVSEFTLVDSAGVTRSLSDYRSAPVVVLAFLGVECPLVELYAPRLTELANEFRGSGVQFLGINANRQDSMQEIDDSAKLLEIPFPILKDPDGQVADEFGARRTPEVVVLDRARNVRYRGRIDDQFAVGVSRPAPTREDLRVAIRAALEGTQTAVTRTESAGCLIGRSHRKAPKGSVTYSSHIAAILDRRCVDCHREGEMAPFPLTNYDDVAGWADMIGEVVDEGRMPPWYAEDGHQNYANDMRLPEEEKRLILDWVADGAPLGDATKVPPIRERPKGWGIPKPDLVIAMSDTPYEVPADGAVDYQHYYIDPKFTEDKWIAAAEVRPGARDVIHHIEVLILPPNQKLPEGEDRDERLDIEGFTYGQEVGRFLYGIGSATIKFPEGTALFVPAGSTLRFQMHYTPNGRATKDLSSFGMVFADPKTIKHRAAFGMVFNDQFLIPANTANYVMKAEQVLPQDSYMFGVAPHMHQRGKTFLFKAHYPDGREETLLNVPNFDFHWQIGCYFDKPKFMPKGTRLYCEATFDNSRNNPSNPDPNRDVPWGIRTADEMMEGHYGLYFAREVGAKELPNPTAAAE